MENECTFCNKHFSKKLYLIKHVKTFHPDQLNEIAPSKPLGKSYCAAVCKKCSKSFSKPSNLKKHVLNFHPAEIDNLISQKEYRYPCKECKRNFSKKHHYTHHCKVHHGEKDVDKRLGVYNCSLCDYKCMSKRDLYNHFEQSHCIKISSKTLYFSNNNDFNSWKNNLEKTTDSWYVNKRSYQTKKGVKIILFVCHRSGIYVSSGSQTSRRRLKGSRKINGVCPSELHVKILNNDNHEVTFIETHVGHDNDLAHLSLTADERVEIARKIASNVPFDSILNDIREDSAASGKLERIHLLTKKDLYNIRQRLTLNNNSENLISDVEIFDEECAIPDVKTNYDEEGAIADIKTEVKTYEEECEIPDIKTYYDEEGAIPDGKTYYDEEGVILDIKTEIKTYEEECETPDIKTYYDEEGAILDVKAEVKTYDEECEIPDVNNCYDEEGALPDVKTEVKTYDEECEIPDVETYYDEECAIPDVNTYDEECEIPDVTTYYDEECAKDKVIQENPQLIQVVSKPNGTDAKDQARLSVEKEKLKITQVRMIEKITTFKQLEAFKKITATLEPTLLAMEKSDTEYITVLTHIKNNNLPLDSPHNKIVLKKSLFSTKRKAT